MKIQVKYLLQFYSSNRVLNEKLRVYYNADSSINDRFIKRRAEIYTQIILINITR